MESGRPSVPGMASSGRRFFLVERYLPSISAGSVESAARRLAEAPDGSARHLVTLLVAREETCLSVFEAADAGAVQAANDLVGFELDRIVEVEVFSGPGPIEPRVERRSEP